MGNNFEIWETFGMLDKFQKFGKFWNLEIKFENLEKKKKIWKRFRNLWENKFENLKKNSNLGK